MPTMPTSYGFQHFIRNELGELAAGRPQKAASAAAAVREASLLARLKPGAVAFRQSHNPLRGELDPPIPIARYGDAPEDLTVF
jgi:hypothetical protein